MIRVPVKAVVLLGFLPLVLAGCGDGGMQDLHQWMEQVKRQTPVRVQKIPPPKQFMPFAYDARNEVDPFNPGKLATALEKNQDRSGGPLKPDLNRRREALESYPLDTIQMVGTLAKPGAKYAIVRADKAIYRVTVGNYLGQNFGKVTNVTDSEVDIREVVQDSTGEWVERKAKLELQENKK